MNPKFITLVLLFAVFQCQAQIDSLANKIVQQNTVLVCNNSKIVLPKVFNQSQQTDIEVHLTEVKQLKIRFFNSKSQEFYVFDLTANYLNEDINSNNQKSKTYSLGWDNQIDIKKIKSENYYYVAEIKDFDNKICIKTASIEQIAD